MPKYGSKSVGLEKLDHRFTGPKDTLTTFSVTDDCEEINVMVVQRKDGKIRDTIHLEHLPPYTCSIRIQFDVAGEQTRVKECENSTGNSFNEYITEHSVRSLQVVKERNLQPESSWFGPKIDILTAPARNTLTLLLSSGGVAPEAKKIVTPGHY
ncbi:hypothetical protein T265_00139 [Opisthorchis viverrini]|uniref:Uncharacterized protein n=1 Tax=Opisthorchis viverrini TaxID=6198 RepID=A0A075A3P4_OPIVI|nr:hypothetical protein T265_00139 [Opisthorchis viverrini]KER34293.1 hypothetical protein T265_00139 [Opisthorchis viverrini]